MKNNTPVIKKKLTGSIAHATEILISLSNGTHKVSDIARQCNISKSSVHRVLKLLEKTQLAVQDNINRRYYVGPLVTQLTLNPANTHKLLTICAMDEMKRLSNITGETVALDVMIGTQYYSIHEIPSKYDLKVTQEKKKIGPLYTGLYAGATVKILLSQLDDDKLKLILNSVAITAETEHTITDKELLMTQLKEIRQKGYAIIYGERIPGTVCLAAPINYYVVPAALCVVGPEGRLQPRIKKYTTELLTAASRISGSIAEISPERR